jgi:seryl-tRNA synthetase
LASIGNIVHRDVIVSQDEKHNKVISVNNENKDKYNLENTSYQELN